MLAQPGVHVAIVGARRPAHVEGIAPAAEISLSEDELAEIDELTGAATGLGPDSRGVALGLALDPHREALRARRRRGSPGWRPARGSGAPA